jgi:hypothetical protein
MQTKFKIIETESYILAVSDEKIKKNNYAIALDTNIVFKVKVDIRGINKFPHLYKKIITYQPKGNAKELDLPLIPEMVVGDEVEKLAEEYASKKLKRKITKYIPLEANVAEYVSFIKGYKAATKTFSEEDLRKAFEAGNKRGWSGYPDTDNWTQPKFEEFIQSLKQPKTPKWFVAEIIDMREYDDDLPFGNLDEPFLIYKTTTINSKTYLVGTYLYE